jgi:hypothetical protein
MSENVHDRARSTPRGGRRLGLLRSPRVWFCLLVIGVFGVRAVTTLASGAGWTVPGTGWRSLWQLVMVALAVGGLWFPRWRTLCVAAIGAVYGAATLLEAVVSGTTLVGLIPVDMRDRVVHPLVVALAVASLAAMSLRFRAPRPRPGARDLT